MEKSRPLALFMVLLLLFEMVTPWNSVYGSSSSSKEQEKEKVYFQWMTHNNFQNKTGSAILRITKVDYNTGLFTKEDVVLGFIDTSKAYKLDSVWGRNTKNPHISYALLKSGTTEKILSYDIQKHFLAISEDRTVTGGIIKAVYPDAGMYVVENASKEYLVYSLSTNKLVHKTKQEPYENSNPFFTNVINGNYFDPELSLGALYVDRVNPGEFPYEIKPDGTIVKLHSYKKTVSDDFVYKKKLSDSVIFKNSKAGDIIKHELIINGQIHTLHETNLKRSDYSYAVAQISPKGKYIVLWIGFIENKRRVKGKEEYRIFDAGTGTLIRKIPIHTTGLSTMMDSGIKWIADTDHIIQSGLLNPATYRTIDSNLITPWSSGNVVEDFQPYYTFSLNDYLSMNDPIPVSFNGKYMRYSSQGTFRLADLTTYSPITELMTLLGGTADGKNGKITVTYQEKSYTLDLKKQIVWKNRTYYPIRDIVSAFGLKLLTKHNMQAADDWMELQIIQ